MSSKFSLTPTLFLAVTLVAGAQIPAQVQNPTQASQSANADEAPPIFRINVVARSITAINYHHRQGSTTIGFRGTDLMPRAEGEARVESRVGTTKLDARFKDLDPAQRYGAEFLTYVLWAITPEGRAQNLGEVHLDGNSARLQAATELQTFGMIVTAEPYWAVTQPSDVVVLENVVIRGKTTGTFQSVNAKYELLQRGTYTMNMPEERLRSLHTPSSSVPLDLLEARNAIAIAKNVGADRYARQTMARAATALQNAEGFHSSGRDSKRMQGLAREAVQLAEDARIITLRRLEEERLEAERLEQERKLAEERAKAEQEAEQARLAEEKRLAEERLRLQAEEQKRMADEQKRMALNEAARAEAAAARAIEEQKLAEERRRQAEAERQAAERARLEAEQARRDADLARQEAEQARLKAEQTLRKLELEKSELRDQLRRNFESIMETRDTARGLIVNMSDVLFDTGQSTLRGEAREKLAKVAGILMSHPGLSVEIEGHTDSVGGDEYNMRLSELRAASVRDYLATQGVPIASMIIRGYGKTQPIASNDTAAGRQKNRRVELVVSGELIGTEAVTKVQ